MENKELDILELKADAIAASIMHRDGYIVKDEKGYTVTGTVLCALIGAVIKTEEGEALLSKMLALIDSATDNV